MASDPLKTAKKRVAEKRDFFIHLTTFIVVMPFLFGINMLTSPFHLWFAYPLMGWGLGLAIHFFTVFGFKGRFYDKWEAKEIEKELERMGELDRKHEEGLELNPEEELELKEFKKLRKDWEDSDFV